MGLVVVGSYNMVDLGPLVGSSGGPNLGWAYSTWDSAPSSTFCWLHGRWGWIETRVRRVQPITLLCGSRGRQKSL